jgi:hypothetical protein
VLLNRAKEGVVSLLPGNDHKNSTGIINETKETINSAIEIQNQEKEYVKQLNNMERINKKMQQYEHRNDIKNGFTTMDNIIEYNDTQMDRNTQIYPTENNNRLQNVIIPPQQVNDENLVQRARTAADREYMLSTRLDIFRGDNGKGLIYEVIDNWKNGFPKKHTSYIPLSLMHASLPETKAELIKEPTSHQHPIGQGLRDIAESIMYYLVIVQYASVVNGNVVRRQLQDNHNNNINENFNDFGFQPRNRRNNNNNNNPPQNNRNNRNINDAGFNAVQIVDTRTSRRPVNIISRGANIHRFCNKNFGIYSLNMVMQQDGRPVHSDIERKIKYLNKYDYNDAVSLSERPYCFCGDTAANFCEHVRHYVREGLDTVCIDVDSYYYQPLNQITCSKFEAGIITQHMFSGHVFQYSTNLLKYTTFNDENIVITQANDVIMSVTGNNYAYRHPHMQVGNNIIHAGNYDHIMYTHTATGVIVTEKVIDFKMDRGIYCIF